jgi:tetratricopeptide (TPR) repeat protein
MMYFWILAIFAVSILHAGDDRKAALWQQADAQYQRVVSGAVAIRDTSGCVQAQMEFLSVAEREETGLALYRKAYCELAAASAGNRRADFAAAAADLEKAYAAWPDRFRPVKNSLPEPAPAPFRLLNWIARFNAGAGQDVFAQAQNEMTAAAAANVCPADALTPAQCASIRRAGREWLGWMALQQGDLYRAVSQFQQAPAPAWTYWTTAKDAFRERRFGDAANMYRDAIEAWSKAAQDERLLFDRVGPKLDRAHALTELGGAQYLAGQAGPAVETLTAALKADPKLAKALYLRGRAKESLGQTEAAIADYNLASRTAFADGSETGAADAHLYRGVMLYLRREYARTESEFSSALTFDVSDAEKNDIEAWMRMASVAAGSCSEYRQALERALETASPFFPKAEARSLASSCLVSVSSAAAAPGSK